MSVVELIVYLAIAGIGGTIERALRGGTRGKVVLCAALGFVGAFVGTWLSRQPVVGPWLWRQFHLPDFLTVRAGAHAFPDTWSIVGAALLVALGHALVRRSHGRRWHARH